MLSHFAAFLLGCVFGPVAIVAAFTWWADSKDAARTEPTSRIYARGERDD